MSTAERRYRTPASWSPNGGLAFVENNLTGPNAHNDIWVLDASATGSAVPVVHTPANEQHPAFSPDGRWLAYSSNESGRDEIYVQLSPGPGPRLLVSIGWGSRTGVEERRL